MGETRVGLLGWLQDWTDGRLIASCDAALAEALAQADRDPAQARALLQSVGEAFRAVALGVDPVHDALNPVALTSLLRGFGSDWRIWASDRLAVKAGEEAADAPLASCAAQVLACWIRLVDRQAASPRMASLAAQALLRCEAALARIGERAEARVAPPGEAPQPAQEAGLR
jgi:ABC-type transporter Mla subunit MlaD